MIMTGRCCHLDVRRDVEDAAKAHNPCAARSGFLPIRLTTEALTCIRALPAFA
jgi:hypothetical protein